MRLQYSVHNAIHNKPAQWSSSFGDDWRQSEGELSDLEAHVSAGGAFIGAAMSSGHRSSQAFAGSQLAVVDIDHGLSIDNFLKLPLAVHAAWVYTTCSHTEEENRFRVIFVLPEAITKPDVYKDLISALIFELGGDKACSDPCRLYYGNSNCARPLWQPKAVLPASYIVNAYESARDKVNRFNLDASELTDIDIAKAIHCLEHVIEPTVDGCNPSERATKFLPITMACNSVGAALFPAWSDWASRGWHGKKNNQSSEKYFRSAVSSNHTLGTVFFWATNDDPDWMKNLPDELKGSERFSYYETYGVAGYDPEDFEETEAEMEMNAAMDELAIERSEALDNGTWYEKFGHTEPELPPDDDEYEPSDYIKTLLENEPDFPDRDNVDDDESGGGPRPVGRPKKREGTVTSRCVDAVKACLQDLRYNMTTGEYEYGTLSKPTRMNPDEVSRIYIDINLHADEDFSKQLCSDTVVKMCHTSRYSPVKKYLIHCASQTPVDYLSTFASTILGVAEEGEENPRLATGQLLADAIMQRFFVGAVARAMEPGCVHDWMPILVGDQACGKSSFLKYIVPPMTEDVPHRWSTTIQQSLSSLANKPHKLHAGWIIILDECERYFDRRHVEKLKNLISTAVDRSDLKYFNDQSFPRPFVLVGACNSVDFLTDPTGNRRFMPIHIKGVVKQGDVKIIDLDRVKRERDRIWAAAYQAYLDNPLHIFDSAELASLTAYANSFAVDNPMAADVAKWTSRPDKFTGIRVSRTTMTEEKYWASNDLLEWMEVPMASRPSLMKPLTDALKEQGFKRIMVRTKGKAHATSAWTRNV